MFISQCFGDTLPICLAAVGPGKADARKEDVQQEKLGDARGDRAVFQRTFVGAALQHHVGKLSAR